MDFGALLNAAKKNEHGKQTVNCYQTKFQPPKKENRQSKVLSQNIKKFLAKKEEEEKRKADEERLKKQNLLALRDQKAQNRINKHLKVCKAANKSVLEDAIDTENTAITMAGPSQPDEDDYGYVSQEASALYNKLMNKYNSLPPEKSIFSATGKKTVKDIASTKDRVKQALKQQEIEESQGHRRKKKSSSTTKNIVEEPVIEDVPEEKKSSENTSKNEKPKPKSKPLPPPMDFGQLLKLAAQKQYEPIVIEVKPKPEEPERLMTKKQLRELAREKECREAREERNRAAEKNATNNNSAVESKRPEKCNGSKSEEFSKTKKVSSEKNSVYTSSSAPTSKKSAVRPTDRNATNLKNTQQKSKEKDGISEERRKLEMERKQLEEMRRSIEEEKRKLELIKGRNTGEKKRPSVQTTKVTNKVASTSGLESSTINNTRHETSLNSKKPSFSSGNMKTSKHPKMLMKNPKQNVSSKRRILDDDDDDYDSELDDFIVDEQEDDSNNYSKYISEIFGYDKSKYRNYDDDDDDDRAMESNFAQQLKEEYVSAKIGIMEDLEDIRQEAMEKKRKTLIKKKRKL